MLSAQLKLQPGDPEKIRAYMEGIERKACDKTTVGISECGKYVQNVPRDILREN